MKMKPSRTIFVAVAASLFALGVASADQKSAQALIKKSGCNTCHSVDKKKVGPSFKETAAKYKGNAGAEAALVTHLTTNPKVMVDGKEEPHDSLKTKDEAAVKDVVQWILSK